MTTATEPTVVYDNRKTPEVQTIVRKWIDTQCDKRKIVKGYECHVWLDEGDDRYAYEEITYPMADAVKRANELARTNPAGIARVSIEWYRAKWIPAHYDKCDEYDEWIEGHWERIEYVNCIPVYAVECHGD